MPCDPEKAGVSQWVAYLKINSVTQTTTKLYFTLNEDSDGKLTLTGHLIAFVAPNETIELYLEKISGDKDVTVTNAEIGVEKVDVF